MYYFPKWAVLHKVKTLRADGFFYLTRPLLLGEAPTFSKTPPSPLNLKRGSTAFP